MLEFGGEEALKMMDGSGQFPLHQAIKHSYSELVKLILSHEPALLAWENAMGQTALELAESLYIRDCTGGNPDIRAKGPHPLEDRQSEKLFPEGDDYEEGNDVRRTWNICRQCAIDNPRARKLVSVSEAREVAKRLAERNKAEREKQERKAKSQEKEAEKDEVGGWLGDRAVRMGG